MRVLFFAAILGGCALTADPEARLYRSLQELTRLQVRCDSATIDLVEGMGTGFMTWRTMGCGDQWACSFYSRRNPSYQCRQSRNGHVLGGLCLALCGLGEAEAAHGLGGLELAASGVLQAEAHQGGVVVAQAALPVDELIIIGEDVFGVLLQSRKHQFTLIGEPPGGAGPVISQPQVVDPVNVSPIEAIRRQQLAKILSYRKWNSKFAKHVTQEGSRFFWTAAATGPERI